MKFLIHYIVQRPLKAQHFDFLWDGPVSAKDIDDLRGICANEATTRTRARIAIDADEVIIAGIFPIPSGEPPAKQIGGS